jgi:hypothetical protein
MTKVVKPAVLDTNVDEKIINLINLDDNALTIQFYGNNLKIAI